ncbi:sugar-binding transcriptional regulator [Rhizobium sp. SSA_523]|uniref:sugar-binding transcriptional regulator n=1 Tax=Rhizobium sp. SSA_523 TaxID=2952477 RepID=UPI00209164E0|nr:sugar-binding transcriptional regulator [Rhizobium sp. SSA_523]MCO5734250.1 sugar-binding transcriptional regulator [Rhizobium sp. SSA_523]WKC21477.1 sugar-binding transcriptional regulator [Rhizobium sp. SSA_523]
MANRAADNGTATVEDMDAQQVRARVAWLYFIGGLTQQEIADQLGLTRLRVNKTLGQLRTDGSVVVDIRLPMAGCIALEHKVKERFGLEEVTVIPTLPDDAENQRAVGDAAGGVLDRLLEDGMGLGVGWGKTLTAGLKRLTPRALPASWVTSIMGGLTRGSGSSTFEVATGYARAISAECWYLTAPLYFPSAESREALLSHYGIRETMRRARSVDVALVSCGDMTARSLLVQTPTVSENLDALLAAGAVGDLLGVFLDGQGQPVDHPLNERVLSVAPEQLRSVRHSVLASGGWYKVAIIRAILRGGYVKRLVTDEQCAAALLDETHQINKRPR